MSKLYDSVKDTIDSLPTWSKAILGVAAVGGSVVVVFKYFKKERKGPYKTDFKPGVVYVYQYPRTTVIPNISPYALKLETWLRLADITYENVDPMPFFLRSKEGTVPFVEYNGIEYDDSSFIIRDLTKILKKESVNASLTPEQKAISRAYEQMIDTSTFWSYGYIRVKDHLDKLLTEEFMGTKIPFLVRLFLSPSTIRRMYSKRMMAHGIGRHPPEEIIGIGLDDIRSISAYLGTKQFLHGDTPTQVDAVLFGYLAQILYIPLESPHKKLINTECKNLVRYLDRIKARVWPDWDEICKTRAMNTWKK